MTLLRRLLIAGSGGSFTVPVGFESFTISDAPEGGWSEVGAPRGAYNSMTDQTIIGYVCGNDRPNDIEVIAWDHASQTKVGPVQLHDHLTGGISTDPDSHNAPAVLVAADGTYITAYCAHRASTMWIRRSTTTDIEGGWELEQNTTLPSAQYTYPNLVYLSDNDTYYLFWRDGSSLYVANSTDGWTTLNDGPTNIYTAPGHLYFAITTNSVDRIDIVVTDTAPELSGGNGLWHFYATSAGTFHETDGTTISGLPFDTTDLTEVQPTDGDIFPYSLSYTADGRPVVGCATQQSTPIMNFEYRWSGSAWERHDVAETGPYTVGGTAGANICIFDDATRAVLTLREGIGDLGQVDEYRTDDDGETWTFYRHVTTDAIQPAGYVHVRDAAPELKVLWMEGPFPAGDDFSVGTAGYA